MVVKISRILVASTFLIASGLFADVMHVKTADEYTKQVQSGKPGVAMYTASWCPPCKAMKPHFKDAAGDYKDIAFIMVDMENKDLSAICEGIKNIPTLIFSHKSKQVMRHTGGLSKTQLRSKLDDFKADISGQERPSSKKVLASADEYYKIGEKQAQKIVDECMKPEFDGPALDKAMVDESSAELYAILHAGDSDPSSKRYKDAFDRLKAYLRGYMAKLKTYKPQNKSPQDAVIRYFANYTKFALAAPDYKTIMEYSMAQVAKLSKRMSKKMAVLRWELLAEVSDS